MLVASFTKTAATEICERAGIQQHGLAGTLHALCYRQLNHPTPAETKLNDWNEFVTKLGKPWYTLSEGAVDFDESSNQQPDATRGDAAYQVCQTLRAQMVPYERWPDDAKTFHGVWGHWKGEANVQDFTDMIELAMMRNATPGNATVGFFDEVQDYTPLELRCIRQWCAGMDTVILAGDDDQCLYGFRGATPDAFLNPPVPDAQKRVLSQSYRVPGVIHAFAQNWIQRVKVREPKLYRPRTDESGAVVPGALDFMANATSMYPEPVVRDIEKQLVAGRSVMVLASCSYQLRPIIALLRKAGIPYHNPYRRKRGDWNPLLRGTEKRTTAVDRLLTFLLMREGADVVRPYTYRELRQWLSVFAADGLERGRKAIVDGLADTDPDTAIDMEAFLNGFADDGDGWLRSMREGSLDWYLKSMLAAKRKPHEYPARVHALRGHAALSEPPRCVVGTVHSVKGGEADVCYVFPDLSSGALRESSTNADALVRMFYVAFTRARERLVLCNQSNSAAMRWQ